MSNHAALTRESWDARFVQADCGDQETRAMLAAAALSFVSNAAF
jgi:hypothetical protein